MPQSFLFFHLFIPFFSTFLALVTDYRVGTNIFIYLLRYNLNLYTAGSARINAKESEKKERQVRREKKRNGTEARRAKPSTPSQAHKRDEEQNGKQKKNKKKQGVSPQPSYPGPFGRLL